MMPEVEALLFEGEFLPPEVAERRERERLESIHRELAGKRDEWVRARSASGVERRWRLSQDMYDGKDSSEDDGTSLESALKNGQSVRDSKQPNRSRVVVNIVRPKVDSATARMCEILLPVDDKNWGIRPTPNPELSEAARTDGELFDPSTGESVGNLKEIARRLMEISKKKAEAMEREIDDALTECGYNGEQRKIIADSVRCGTGVLRGPFPAARVRKSYERMEDPVSGQIAFSKVEVTVIKPGSDWVDFWDVFPDPSCGDDHQRGSGVFQRKMATRKEIRALVDVPGYDPEAIRRVLSEPPRKITVADGKLVRENCPKDLYEMWLYSGEIEPEQMRALSAMGGNVLNVSRGVLVMVGDVVIGSMELWTDDLPYDFVVWRKSEDSPFGYGLGDDLSSQQRVVNAAWRMVMDNGGVSGGPQIVAMRSVITPVNGRWEITPRKLWYAKDDLDDARKAFAVFDIPNRTPELMQIAQTAMALADQESNLPLIMQGDAGAAPDSVGGMTMVMNQANSVLRHRVKLFDDCVTRPHLRRYYDWFMANSEKPEIKGDFEVDARGSSALIERDIQNQAMLNVANLATNPIYGPLLQQKAAPSLRAILKSFRLDPDDHCPTDEEIEAEAQKVADQEQPADPQVLKAQAQVQIKEMDLQDKQAQREFETQAQQGELAYKHQALEYNRGREQSEYQIAMTQEQNARDLELAKLAQKQEIEVAGLRQEAALTHLKIDTDRQIFNAEAAIKARQGSGI